MSERKFSECSFRPQINKPKKLKREKPKKRSLENFLQDQDKFQMRKSQNKSVLKKSLQTKAQEAFSHHPQICKKSDRLFTKSRICTSSVYDRLYTEGSGKSSLFDNRDGKLIKSRYLHTLQSTEK